METTGNSPAGNASPQTPPQTEVTPAQPAMPQPSLALRVRFSGRVQGVGFRVTVTELVRELAVCGWVRNRVDGTVELLLSGDSLACEDLLRRIALRFRGFVKSTERLPVSAADLAELPTVNGVVIRPTA